MKAFVIFLIVASLAYLSWDFLDRTINGDPSTRGPKLTAAAENAPRPPAAVSLPDNELYPLEVNYVRGQPINYSQPVLVEFWATWCGPCRQTIPHLNKLYAEFAPRGLQIVGLSSESPSKIKNFMRHMPMDYAVAVDPGGRYSKQLNVRGIPHAFLLDRGGNIVWKGHPARLNAKIIEKVL
jgi:thiol-disulfide isomerase/thioredoxin